MFAKFFFALAALVAVAVAKPALVASPYAYSAYSSPVVSAYSSPVVGAYNAYASPVVGAYPSAYSAYSAPVVSAYSGVPAYSPVGYSTYY